jgi:septum formation protein
MTGASMTGASLTRLILASGSPRRRGLLSSLGASFDVMTVEAEEAYEGEPAPLVMDNALAKAEAGAARAREREEAQPWLVLGADTLVFLDEHVLPKPASLEEARSMLAMLSGRTHQVLTGLAAVSSEGEKRQAHEATEVTFRELSPEEIDRFIEVVRPLDRAGAYTAEGPGSLLIQGFRGCYHNVLGLPLVRLDALLRQFGLSLFDRLDASRAKYL